MTRCEACFSKDGHHIEMELHESPATKESYFTCPRCHTDFGMDGELIY